MFHGEKDAASIDVHDAFVNLFRSGDPAPTFPTDTCIVKGEIQSSKTFLSTSHQRGYLRFDVDIGAHKQPVTTRFLDQGNRFSPFVLAPAGYDNVRTAFSECDRCRPPDTGGSAGD